jgi:hypothetical protein
MKVFCVLALMVFLATGVSAQMNVLLVQADYDYGSAAVQQYLTNLGYFSSVDIYNAQAGTPTLGELSAYQAVLVWSNYTFADNVGLGNVLADYADAGGGVVLATFCYYDATGWNLSGRIMDDGYSPLNPVNSSFAWADLGTYDPNHPIMQGVSAISGYFRDITTVDSGATLVASWADGNPFVAVNTLGGGNSVVGIALFPDDQITGPTGDYPVLFGNALKFSAVPEPGLVSMLGAGILALGGLALRRRK